MAFKLQMKLEQHTHVDISFQYSDRQDDYLIVVRSEEGRNWILENMRHPVLSDEFHQPHSPHQKFYGVCMLSEQYFASAQYENVFVSDWTSEHTHTDVTVEALKRVMVDRMMQDGLSVTFPEFPLLSIVTQSNGPTNLRDTRETISNLLSWVFFNKDYLGLGEG